MTLGDLIKHQRERARMSKTELARRAGLSSRAHVAMIEKGVRVKLDPRVFQGLSKALKIDMDTLIAAAAEADVERGT